MAQEGTREGKKEATFVRSLEGGTRECGEEAKTRKRWASIYFHLFFKCIPAYQDISFFVSGPEKERQDKFVCIYIE